MKLSESSLLSNELIQFECDEIPTSWQIGEPVSLQVDGNAYLIRQGDLVCVGRVIGHYGKVALQVQRGLTLWVLRQQNNTILQLQSLDLVEQIQLDMALYVDEALAEQLAHKGEISVPGVQDTVIWLTERFIAPDDRHDSEMARIFLGRFENDSDDGFVLFGAGWRGAVKRDASGLRLISVTRLRGTPGRVAMATGRISFQDASVDTRLRSPEQRALLDAALRDNGSYLRLWQEYGALEWEQAQDCARELSSLRYKGAELIEGELWAWRLKVDSDELKGFRKRWHALGLSSTTQVELGEKEFAFDCEVQDAQNPMVRTRRRPIRGALQLGRDEVILTPSQDRRSEQPPTNGFVYYSLSGDETVQNRRARARQSINDGRRLPQLSYLLEGVAPPIARRRQLAGLTPYAKACFKGPPTDRQKEALSIAINTPDIALIVGPPGTGKTQVIAALQRRLAETLGENSLQHQVLISSYQHDAVDNALNRAEVFGLPAVRVGGKGRRDKGGIDPIDVWCERKRKEISTILDSRRLNEPLAQPLEELDRRIATLRLASLSTDERQTQFEAIDALLRRLAALELRLPPALRIRWEDFLEQNKRVESQRQASSSIGLVRLLRSLRTSTVGFADDGVDRAYQLERALRRGNVALEEQEWQLLKRLSSETSVSKTDLTQLAAFKDALLDRLKPDYRPPQLKQVLNDAALEILSDIELAIDEPLLQSRRGISSVVSSYHAALAQEPKEAARAVREYASIVGATCQQSAGKAMSSLKELSNLEASEDIEFDTVVIDEAARANPLDLFVPMAMARRRIVLVGDHRQLPHLVQRDLEDELIAKQSLTETQAKAYEQSLFERLVKQLREQEKVDGIKRVVMLDTQYRMHPTLGNFISKQFYESEGLGVLHSGKTAQDFAHSIPGYQGQCAAWLDIPLQEGKEKYLAPGYERRSEARAIAKEVKRITDACGPELSIGVISFYRAQCDCILDAFIDQGLAETEDGEVRISGPYRKTGSGDERLRVGTVDAFQGKEFDVVFLSVVRANDKVISGQADGIKKERLLNGKYGHLRVANRLNVAMSRQRKLLIAVGDMCMAQGPESEEAVPALTEFLKLCKKEMANGS